jgi:hypothetical protein
MNTPDKMRVKSVKTGKEQELTPDEYKTLEQVVGPGKFDVLKENTTPPEAAAARARTSAAAETGKGDKEKN